MKINWFTPLPPSQTGIADYSASLLPHLQKYAGVTVWTDQENWDPALNQIGEIRRYRSMSLVEQQVDWPAVNRADISVFHIGNHPVYHSAIWEVSQRHPGVVVLHDFRLQHLFAHIFGVRYGEPRLLVEKMNAVYGPEAGHQAEAFWRGETNSDILTQRFPLTPLVLENSIGAIVHSLEPMNALREQGYGPLLHLPFPYAAPPARTRMASSEPPFHIAVCGYIGTNRRLESIIRALSALPERGKFRLEVYGPLVEESAIHNLAKSAGVFDLVRFHGLTPPAKLDEALESIDLAFNLRNPTMGEASMSQLQLWSHSIPTFITPLGWYATLPEDAVVHIRPESELADIQDHLRRFLDEPSRYWAVGHRGREVMKGWLPPDRYAEMVIRFLENQRAESRRPTAAYLAERVASDLEKWLPRESLDLVLDRFAEEIAKVSGVVA